VDASLARAALEPLAAQLGRGVEDLALGMIRVCVSNMVGQIRAVTSERGLHPRDHTLVAGGGAGPLHAAQIAAELGIETAIVPAYPGLLSAAGLVQSDIRLDSVRSFPAMLAEQSYAEIKILLQRMVEDGARSLREEGHIGNPLIEVSLDLRYEGQNWQIRVPISLDMSTADIARAFDEEHERLYGFSLGHHNREIINLRAAAVGGSGNADVLTPTRRSTGRISVERTPYWDEETNQILDALLVNRDLIIPTWQGIGPMVIYGTDAIVWIPPKVEAQCDDFGNLVLDLRRRT
jgi:N-methylhydantoinase A